VKPSSYARECACEDLAVLSQHITGLVLAVDEHTSMRTHKSFGGARIRSRSSSSQLSLQGVWVRKQGFTRRRSVGAC
jgi:hypothetical protein